MDPGLSDLPGCCRRPENGGEHLEARRKIVADVVSYVVINAFLVFVWLVAGAGYFWPGWVTAGWGIPLVLHVWDVFWRRPITEADVDAEVSRTR